MEWLPWEQKLESAVSSVFDWAFADDVGGSELAAAIADETQPVLENVHSQSMVLLLLLWMAQEDDLRSAWEGVDDLDNKRRIVLNRRAGRNATRHAKRLGRQLSRSTERMKRRRPDDFDPDLWDERVFGRSRSEAIGITETTRAIQYGEDLAAQQAIKMNYNVRAAWRTAKDEHVCPVCGPLEGKGYEVYGKLFPDGPPAHVRCRCRRHWLLYRD